MPKTHWTTTDRRRIALVDLEDSHVLSIIQMGLKAVARQERSQALAAFLVGAPGDEGCQAHENLALETEMTKFTDPTTLYRALKATTRFGPVVAEAERRRLSLVTH